MSTRQERRRKRSRMIWLGIGAGAGAIVIADLAWQGTDDAVSAEFFRTPEECRASGKHSAEDCDRLFTAAAVEQRETAPHYAERADCEAEFGADACLRYAADPSDAASLPASFFVPAMAGILVGQAIGQSLQAPAPVPVYRNCPPDARDPDCAPRSSGGGGSGGA